MMDPPIPTIEVPTTPTYNPRPVFNFSKSRANLSDNLPGKPGLAGSAGSADSFDSSQARGRFFASKKPKPPNYPIKCQVLQRKGNKNFRASVACMQGIREDMEDAHSAVPELRSHPDCGFFGVFDGHSGSIAADWCATNAHEYVDKLPDFTEDTLTNCGVLLDQNFLKETNTDPPVLDGTTAVFVVAHKTSAGADIFVSNLGDSRCIVGSYTETKIKPMTVDHKPTDPAEVARVEAAGGQVVRGRVDGLLAVSRSIGDVTYKDVSDVPFDKQKVIAVPTITNCTITSDNFLFICCDGIFETFTNEEAVGFIHERFQKNPDEDPCMILSDLLNAVLTRGSKDNMTAMIVELKDGSKYNKPNQFIVGEYFERANPSYHDAFKKFCEKAGKDVDEAKREWEQIKPPEEKSLSLDELSAKFCKTECLAASALRDAFMNAAGGKKRHP